MEKELKEKLRKLTKGEVSPFIEKAKKRKKERELTKNKDEK